MNETKAKDAVVAITSGFGWPGRDDRWPLDFGGRFDGNRGELKKLGGVSNGIRTADLQTMYVVTSRELLPIALHLEAERMVRLKEVVTAETLDVEARLIEREMARSRKNGLQYIEEDLWPPSHRGGLGVSGGGGRGLRSVDSHGRPISVSPRSPK